MYDTNRPAFLERDLVGLSVDSIWLVWVRYRGGEPVPQPGTKCRGEGILRMEDAGTSEEDDTDSQDSNIPTDHSHLPRIVQ